MLNGMTEVITPQNALWQSLLALPQALQLPDRLKQPIDLAKKNKQIPDIETLLFWVEQLCDIANEVAVQELVFDQEQASSSKPQSLDSSANSLELKDAYAGLQRAFNERMHLPLPSSDKLQQLKNPDWFEHEQAVHLKVIQHNLVNRCLTPYVSYHELLDKIAFQNIHFEILPIEQVNVWHYKEQVLQPLVSSTLLLQYALDHLAKELPEQQAKIEQFKAQLPDKAMSQQTIHDWINFVLDCAKTQDIFSEKYMFINILLMQTIGVYEEMAFMLDNDYRATVEGIKKLFKRPEEVLPNEYKAYLGEEKLKKFISNYNRFNAGLDAFKQLQFAQNNVPDCAREAFDKLDNVEQLPAFIERLHVQLNANNASQIQWEQALRLAGQWDRHFNNLVHQIQPKFIHQITAQQNQQAENAVGALYDAFFPKLATRILEKHFVQTWWEKLRSTLWSFIYTICGDNHYSQSEQQYHTLVDNISSFSDTNSVEQVLIEIVIFATNKKSHEHFVQKAQVTFDQMLIKLFKNAQQHDLDFGSYEHIQLLLALAYQRYGYQLNHPVVRLLLNNFDLQGQKVFKKMIDECEKDSAFNNNSFIENFLIARQTRPRAKSDDALDRQPDSSLNSTKQCAQQAKQLFGDAANPYEFLSGRLRARIHNIRAAADGTLRLEDSEAMQTVEAVSLGVQAVSLVPGLNFLSTVAQVSEGIAKRMGQCELKAQLADKYYRIANVEGGLKQVKLVADQIAAVLTQEFTPYWYHLSQHDANALQDKQRQFADVVANKLDGQLNKMSLLELRHAREDGFRHMVREVVEAVYEDPSVQQMVKQCKVVHCNDQQTNGSSYECYASEDIRASAPVLVLARGHSTVFVKRLTEFGLIKHQSVGKLVCNLRDEGWSQERTLGILERVPKSNREETMAKTAAKSTSDGQTTLDAYTGRGVEIRRALCTVKTQLKQIRDEYKINNDTFVAVDRLIDRTKNCLKNMKKNGFGLDAAEQEKNQISQATELLLATIHQDCKPAQYNELKGSIFPAQGLPPPPAYDATTCPGTPSGPPALIDPHSPVKPLQYAYKSYAADDGDAPMDEDAPVLAPNAQRRLAF